MVKIPTYPRTLYHPVHGPVEFKSAEEEQKKCIPEHDWFETAAEAESHRTEREAAIAYHNLVAADTQRAKDEHKIKEIVEAGVPNELVRRSLVAQAEESVKAAEAMKDRKDLPAEPGAVPQATRVIDPTAGVVQVVQPPAPEKKPDLPPAVSGAAPVDTSGTPVLKDPKG